MDYDTKTAERERLRNETKAERARALEQIEQTKKEIEQQIKRVPPVVNAGGVQLARDYKTRVKNALALIGKKNAKIDDLRAALAELRYYYSPDFRGPLSKEMQD